MEKEASGEVTGWLGCVCVGVGVGVGRDDIGAGGRSWQHRKKSGLSSLGLSYLWTTTSETLGYRLWHRAS